MWNNVKHRIIRKGRNKIINSYSNNNNNFYYLLLYARHCAGTLYVLSHSILTTVLNIGIIVYPILQMKNLS